MSTQKPDKLKALLSSYLKELIETPDTEILESERDRDLPGDFGEQLLKRAKAEAGRRRLANGKQGVALSRNASAYVERLPNLTPKVAREFLARHRDDLNLTLAARNLEELSDDDAVRLAQQVQRLSPSKKPQQGDA